MASRLTNRLSAAASGHLRRLTSLSGGFAAAVIVACLMVIALEAWHAWESRVSIIAEERVETANLARSLAQHVHDLMQAADVVLLQMRESVELDGLTPEGLDRLNRRMRQTIETVPMLHGLFVFDATGQRLLNSVGKPGTPLNNGDRDYFRYHRDHHDGMVFVGKPLRSRSDGRWVMTVSRRIDKPDGTFGGVIQVTISIDALRAFYATFEVGGGSAITLLSSDGIVMVRQAADATPSGTDWSDRQIFRDLLPKAPVGSFATSALTDGSDRIASYRRVDAYPLVVVVSAALREVLQAWRADVVRHVAISIPMVLALGIVGIRLARQIDSTQRADCRYRLLADNASDVIVCVGLDGRRLYMSPSFSVLTGWHGGDGLTLPWEDFVHPEDHPAVRDIALRLAGGGGPLGLVLRYLRKDGQERWAEARVQPVAASSGMEAQFVINLRDITKRKLAQDQVESLNRKLAIQAVTDGLTGLANRRRFDEAIEQEWRRAARERRSLSLAVIDIDHFKRFNDRHGHQRGDQCLRLVADVVAGCARRAGDMAARYGGEEFVILLPGTDRAAATEQAEQIRLAIQSMGLHHAGNPPSGVVTVSVGVATISPTPESNAAACEKLFAAADVALYKAKRSGRNRVVARDTARSAEPLLQG